MDAIFHRTSVRQFEDREIEQEKIDRILRAAMQAPTAVNQQSWEFYVVKNKQIIEELSKSSEYAGCVANAPLAIVIAYNNDTIVPMYNDIDAAICAENIWLEADALGLGTLMIGTAPIKSRMETVGRIMNLPENQSAFTIMPIGYPVKVNPQKDRFDESKVHYVE